MLDFFFILRGRRVFSIVDDIVDDKNARAFIKIDNNFHTSYILNKKRRSRRFSCLPIALFLFLQIYYRFSSTMKYEEMDERAK